MPQAGTRPCRPGWDSAAGGVPAEKKPNDFKLPWFTFWMTPLFLQPVVATGRAPRHRECGPPNSFASKNPGGISHAKSSGSRRGS